LFVLKNTRMTLFHLFRVTADPVFRVTITPIRMWFELFCRRTNTMCLPKTALPSPLSFVKSLGSQIRSSNESPKAFLRLMKCYFFGMETARRLRPLRLLRAMTNRPAFVLILFRKPCVRLRLVLLGWYVLFIKNLWCGYQVGCVAKRRLYAPGLLKSQ